MSNVIIGMGRSDRSPIATKTKKERGNDITAGSLELAYSLIRGAHQIWRQDLGSFFDK